MYDAIIQKKAVDQSPTIRQQPLYLTWRYRTVYELMKRANVDLATKNKAMGVFDFSDFH